MIQKEALRGPLSTWHDSVVDNFLYSVDFVINYKIPAAGKSNYPSLALSSRVQLTCRREGRGRSRLHTAD